jgi:hypothetical protein
MAKNKRSRDEAEADTYDSDGGFVEADEDAPKKKSKKAAPKAKALSSETFWPVRSSLTTYLIT